ncbi:hypothetical protein ACLB2K_046780 [Fragaria x ananassa]
MDRGMRPNAATYTAVFEGFTRKEDKAVEEEGKAFVKVLMDKGFVPNVMDMMEVLKGKPTSVITSVMSIVLEVTLEAKERAIKAKLRGGNAFERKDYQAVVDAYTQVQYISLNCPLSN